VNTLVLISEVPLRQALLLLWICNCLQTYEPSQFSLRPG